MKTLSYVIFTIALTALFISCQSTSNPKQILSNTQTRIAIMDTIANSRDMMKEMMDVMMNSENCKTMMQGNGKMSMMMPGNHEKMMRMMKDNPDMMQGMISDMMEACKTDTNMMHSMCKTIIADEQMMKMMHKMKKADKHMDKMVHRDHKPERSDNNK